MSDKSKVKSKDIINILDKNKLLKYETGRLSKHQLFGVQTDSRFVEEGVVFVCIQGYKVDGHDFAQQAINDGAELLITERKLPLSFPQLIVTSTRKAAAVLAAFFFNYPTKKMKLIGITGTNGKTTTANLLYQLLIQNHHKVGLIGTLGFSINGKDHETALTTPDFIQLNEIFTQMVEEEVEYVIMEVSSHSLYLDRVYGLKFQAALFTNLTQDHLDFHVTMEEYAEAKYKIFSLLDDVGFAVLNIDDPFGLKFYTMISRPKISIGLSDNATYRLNDLTIDNKGSSFSLTTPDDVYTISSTLSGQFNIYNLTQALVVYLKLTGESITKKLCNQILELKPVKGRLESIHNKKNIGIYVDYAHTPDALENVLLTLKNLKPGRLICVFGAGGERDASKRPLMFNAVSSFADLAIITNDNPRSEEPAGILSDILTNTLPDFAIWIQPDRKVAIETAVAIAKQGDIVLIAGKGHEDYQIIGKESIPFSDSETVRNYLESEKTVCENSLEIPIHPAHIRFFLTGEIGDTNLPQINYISTDSRQSKANSLFIALKGENFDGHDYVENFLKEDNCLAVVNKSYPFDNKRLIKVDDPLFAYGELARSYKRIFKIHTIAITGSVGKTTTKEYLANILGLKHKILKTAANENNLVGLPKTLFKLRTNHSFAILELGSNHYGEIGRLADIAAPDSGIITSIGASHLEFFGNQEGVFKEKKTLFDRDLQFCFKSADDGRFDSYSGISFGFDPKADFKLSKIEVNADETYFEVNECPYMISSGYSTFVNNAVIAVAVAVTLHINNEEISFGLRQPLGVQHRMEVVKSGSRTLLIDCYNANPDSMRAAIDFWKGYLPEQPHYAILGDMLELGAFAELYHIIIGKELSNIKDTVIFGVGALALNYKPSRHYENIEKLIESQVDKEVPLDAVILIKASHSIRLEKIIGRL